MRNLDLTLTIGENKVPRLKVKMYNMVLQGKGHRVDVATENGFDVNCA